MFGGWGIGHWIIVLVVVLVIFGTKKLRNIGSDLGAAVKGFKDGVKSGGDPAPEADAAPTQKVTANKAADPNTVDVEAKTKS